MSLFPSKVKWAAIGAALLIVCGPPAGRCLSTVSGVRTWLVLHVTAGGASESSKTGKDGAQQTPKCTRMPFFVDIEIAKTFLTRALASPSLPNEVNASLQDAQRRLVDQEKGWQSLPDGSACDATALVADAPVGKEDTSNLLAVAIHYLEKAETETQAGSTAQVRAVLQAVLQDIRTAQANLPSRIEPETGKTVDILLGVTALVFLLALSVAFWYPQVSRLCAEVRVLSTSTTELGAENRRAQSELSSLRGKLEALAKIVEQQEAGMRRDDVDSDKDREQEARDMTLEDMAVVGASKPQPSENVVLEGERVERDSGGLDAASPATVPGHEPVEDYNQTRVLRTSDRVERFRELYPSQRKLECINSSARMSTDPTTIRLKDDPFGILLAVVEGQKAYVFPNLTYGYDSGRSSLEGVFTYPPEGVLSSRVVQAAIAERDGEEWRLTTRGQFGG